MNTLIEAQFRALQAKPRVSGSRVAQIVAMRQGPTVDFPGNPLGPQPARIVASLTFQALSAAFEARRPVLLVFENDDPARPVIVDIVIDHPFSGVSEAQSPTSREPDRDAHPIHRSEPVAIAARLARIAGIEDDLVLVDSGTDAEPPIAASTTVTLRNLKDPVVVLSLADGSAAIVGQVFTFVPVEAVGGESAEVLLKGTRVIIEADEELVLKSGACVLKLDARGKAVTTADQIVSRARGANKVQGASVQLN